ncbi:hypothetical protein BX611_0743 [Lutibacter oceani]|uniref:Uncharacterized protein n=1 Tax=Lutibacter oceani TaxID=1853311 RepID=A0A3D9S4G6_9FLAO|nr:hypothetical protein [Lutibacter oceani]REE83452.1 hypothetical protein BX611_0743 [Lutibacter oceani]
MKRLLSSFLMLLFCVEVVHSQSVNLAVNNPEQEFSNFQVFVQQAKTDKNRIDLDGVEMYNFYTIQKNNKQKTGWILLGSGAALMTAAIVWGSSDDKDSFGFSDNFDTQAILFLTGGVTSIASIPFFVSSGTNKRKAILTLNNATTNFKSVAANNYVILGLKVYL